MRYLTDPLFIGAVAVLAILALGALTANRLIRRKLRLSLLLLAVCLALDLFVRGTGRAGTAAQFLSIEQLLLALALINLSVALLFNPFRHDRASERWPSIVQDAVTYGLFLIVATVVMQEKFLTTSAVGAVVVGFALQDTLGNMFSGLALQVERPFSMGHWIAVGQLEGKVSEITWRATKLWTKAGNVVVVPNSFLSKETITNYSEPARPTRLQIDIGASYDAPPNHVKQIIRGAIAHDPLILKTPAPHVLIADFGSSAMVYRVFFWIDDFSMDDQVRDRVRSAVYYAFRRNNVEIPYPVQVEIDRADSPVRPELNEMDRAVATVDLLKPLPEAERDKLARLSTGRLYGRGETVVRQGDVGSSLFIVSRGRVRVLLQPSHEELATIGPGGYFGEMSLLTGEARSATVEAIEDTVLVEITAEVFRDVVLAWPAVVEQISARVEARRSELDRALSAMPAGGAAEIPRTLFSRVQEFLRLGG